MLRKTPTDHLLYYSRQYPTAWSLADLLRQGRARDLPDWPAWCYLPLSGWYAVVSQGSYAPLTLEQAGDISRLGALGAWRCTQGIYRFDPDLMAALLSTDLSGDLPTEVLFRLPEWCVYIETPAHAVGEGELSGFFSYLEHDTETGRAELRLVLAFIDGRLTGAAPLHLGDWPLSTALDKGVSEAQIQAINLGPVDLLRINPVFAQTAGIARDLAPLVSLLLYLCSDAPDMAGPTPGAVPKRPHPKKTQKGWRLFPPDKPRIWRLGETLGEQLRQAASSPRTVKPSGHTSPRPHIRRAHWHGYWSGPKEERPGGEPRRYRYLWLPPTIVGADGE